MRLIDADAAVARFKEAFELISGGEALPAAAIGKMIEIFFTEEKHTPTIDPIRHGVWQVIRDGGKTYRCSRCGKQMDHPCNYCPDCGQENEVQEVNWNEADDADAPRLLTLDELRALPVGAVVWYEQRAIYHTYIMPMVVTADGHIGNWELGVCMDAIGQDDRCWSARPTDEQREAVKWEAVNWDD